MGDCDQDSAGLCRASWRTAPPEPPEMHGRRGEREGDASASTPAAADRASGCPLEQDAGPAENSFPAPRSGPSGGCRGPCHPQSCCPKCSARPLSSAAGPAGMWGPGLSGNLAAVALSMLNSVCPWWPLNEAPPLPSWAFIAHPALKCSLGRPCLAPPLLTSLSVCAPLPASLAGRSQPPYSLPPPLLLPLSSLSPSPFFPLPSPFPHQATYFLCTLARSPSSPFPPAILSQDPCWPHFPPASPVF